MASAILLVAVLAVTGAVTSGQQHALEAQERINGAVVADELLGQIVCGAYSALPTWHGHVQEAGTLRGSNGHLLPPSLQGLSRESAVHDEIVTVGPLQVRIRGRRVIAMARDDATGRVLARVERFVPEPAP